MISKNVSKVTSAMSVKSTMNGKVGVALINWNGGEFTIPCIESLLQGTRQPDLIVVIDNASIDGSPTTIADTFPQVSLIRNQCNVGFAGGNNQAIEFLLSNGCDYIWILNNDTIVARDCLTVLLKTAQRYPAAAGFSGKIYYDDPPDRLWYAGATRHPIHKAPKHFSTDILDCQAVGGAVPVNFISGCCMLAPGWVFQKVGGFINAYVAYSEDSEWCWCVTKLGLSLYYVPSACLWHRLSASVKKNTSHSRAIYLMGRNHLWTVRRHIDGYLFRTFCILVNAGIQVRNCAVQLLKGNVKAAWAGMRGLMSGLFGALPTDIPHFPNSVKL